ncbi:transporter [Robbsia andropogonis]|uniref:Transporter n=1 Tax=Robbsia andropogonis TaxID=28092 RepID=A0A0F5JXY0_9BURK|nr:MFS transporter [Robbsia andropogonis]KKB62504.1 transporter [Robbsia andropogonis]
MGLFSEQPYDEGLPGPERRLAMIAVMTATAMAVLDGSIVNIALPSIGRALHVSPAATIWVANGYLLTAAMTLIMFAALASRVGFRALFSGGLAVFTLASLGCALSTSLDVLTAMRLLQGLGGAAMLSIGPAVYRVVFPTRLLGRILGLNALLVAASTAIGPTLGGTLLTVLGWQWLFAINVPLGAIAILLSLRAIPDNRTPTSAPFDVAGAVLSAVAMGALIMATDSCARLGEPATYMHTVATAGGYAGLAIVCGILFVLRQRRALQPLLPLNLFASSRFSLAALTSLASFTGQGITFIALPFLFQNAYGYDAFISALLFTPWPIGIVLAAPHAGRLADRYPPAALSTAGLFVFTIGMVLLSLLPMHATPWDIGWRALLCGMGFGFFQSPNNREMLGNVSRALSGNASGVLAVVRTFGQCLGAALVAIVLAIYTTPRPHDAHSAAGIPSLTDLDAARQDAHAMQLSLLIAASAGLVATVISLTRLRAKPAG